MTDRLADITARIEGIHQLGAVVNAMRGIAAARAREAREQLGAVDTYTATIGAAIGRALALLPEASSQNTTSVARSAVVLFCAEEGFAGAFSERALDKAGSDLKESEFFLIGTRGISVAAERGIVASWQCAMSSHSLGIPKLADHITKAIYERVAKGKIDTLDVIFSLWQPAGGAHVERRRLFPFDRATFPKPSESEPPILNLAPEVLLDELTADYLYAQLCNAALHSFSAENEARMEAMAAARNQIDRMLVSLQAKQRLVRQEEITAEIIELAAGETASRGADC